MKQELDTFQKHFVYYCKGAYNFPKGEKGFFEGLKMIWAIRCGYDYNSSKDTLSYVANDIFEIISICMPNRLSYLMEQIHKEVGNQAFYKPKDMLPIEAILWEYRSLLVGLKVKKQVGKRYKWIINLSKPQYRLFNRILRGNGKHEDYYKVK